MWHLNLVALVVYNCRTDSFSRGLFGQYYRDHMVAYNQIPSLYISIQIMQTLIDHCAKFSAWVFLIFSYVMAIEVYIIFSPRKQYDARFVFEPEALNWKFGFLLHAWADAFRGPLPFGILALPAVSLPHMYVFLGQQSSCCDGTDFYYRQHNWLEWFALPFLPRTSRKYEDCLRFMWF